MNEDNRSMDPLKLKLITIFFFLAALPHLATARTPPGEEVIRRYTWEGTISPGATVDVTNLHGDIRARRVNGSNVFLIGMIQKAGREAADPVIEAINDEKTLTISVKYPELDGAGKNGPSSASPVRRVDLTVLIPAGGALRAETDKGFIQAKGIKGDVIARSSTGNIVITTHGCADARTERGSISVHLKNPVWNKSPTLETLTGDIQARLPKNADVEVLVETSGEITTDYSINIERARDSHLKRARAVVSDGGRTMRIKSDRGNIKLLRPFPELKKSRTGE